MRYEIAFYSIPANKSGTPGKVRNSYTRRRCRRLRCEKALTIEARSKFFARASWPEVNRSQSYPSDERSSRAPAAVQRVNNVDILPVCTLEVLELPAGCSDAPLLLRQHLRRWVNSFSNRFLEGQRSSLHHLFSTSFDAVSSCAACRPIVPFYLDPRLIARDIIRTTGTAGDMIMRDKVITLFALSLNVRARKLCALTAPCPLHRHLARARGYFITLPRLPPSVLPGLQTTCNENGKSFALLQTGVHVGGNLLPSNPCGEVMKRH